MTNQRRRKVRAYDPFSNDKSGQAAYHKKQKTRSHGSTLEDGSNDPERLTGSAKRFARQQHVSDRLNARQGGGGGNGSGGGDGRDKRTPSLKKNKYAALHAQQTSSSSAAAAASSAADKKLHQRKRIRHENMKLPVQKPLKKGKKRKERHDRSLGPAREGLTEANFPERVNGMHNRTAATKKKDPALVFTTKLKEGESFSNYQTRVTNEKRRKLLGEVATAKAGVSDRRRRYLDNKNEYKAYKKAKAKAAAEDEDSDSEWIGLQERLAAGLRPTVVDPSRPDQLVVTQHKVPKKTVAVGVARPIAKFGCPEDIEFGDIVDRPPTFITLPQAKKARQSNADIARAAIAEMAERERAEAATSGGDDSGDKPDPERIRQAVAAQRAQIAAEKQQRMYADMRDRAQAAYKAAKIGKHAGKHKKRAGTAKQLTESMSSW